ncbi:branched-chain amino acid ABC transporter permease [Catenulispora yoronensis]
MTTSISELSAQVRRLRKHDAWYKNPLWGRLAVIECLALVLSIMTNETQGSPSDYTLLFKDSWFCVRGVQFLVAGAIVFVIAEVWRARGLSRIAAQATQPVRDLRRNKVLTNPWTKRGVLLAVTVIAVLLPLMGMFTLPYFQSVLAGQVGVYVLAALGLNVVVGWAGLLDLGYIAFFAIGAYTTAILSGKLPVGDDGNPELHPPIHLNLFFAFPIAVLLTMVAGLILGAPTLRLRGDYLAIVTLGFHEIVLNVAKNDPRGLTNGSLGATSISTFRFNLFGVHYDWRTNDAKPYWYLAIGIIIVVVFAFRRLEHSKVGRSWTAIREDEVAAPPPACRPSSTS